MNVEQARKNVAIVERELEEADRNLQNHHGLVKAASEEVARLEATLGAANSLLLTAIANEPTEDKVIDMSHFIDSGLEMEFWNGVLKMKWSGYLHVILNVSNCKYTNKHGESFEYCSPKFNYDYASMTGWDKPPIPEGYVINFLHYDGQCGDKCCDYNDMVWEDVRIFRITSIKDGCKHE